MNGPASILNLPRFESRLFGAMTAVAVALFAALVLYILSIRHPFQGWGDFTLLWLVAGMSPQEAGSFAYDAEEFHGLISERFPPRPSPLLTHFSSPLGISQLEKIPGICPSHPK